MINGQPLKGSFPTVVYLGNQTPWSPLESPVLRGDQVTQLYKKAEPPDTYRKPKHVSAQVPLMSLNGRKVKYQNCWFPIH